MTSIEPGPFGASSRHESHTPHGSGVGPLHAVQAAGQDARARGLAAAARAAEQVGVVDPSGGERCAQRLGDVVLADHLGEGGRAVLAVQRNVARTVCHATTVISADDDAPRAFPSCGRRARPRRVAPLVGTRRAARSARASRPIAGRAIRPGSGGRSRAGAPDRRHTASSAGRAAVERRPSSRRTADWRPTRNGRCGNRRSAASARTTRTGSSANLSRSTRTRDGCSSTAITRAPGGDQRGGHRAVPRADVDDEFAGTHAARRRRGGQPTGRSSDGIPTAATVPRRPRRTITQQLPMIATLRPGASE